MKRAGRLQQNGHFAELYKITQAINSTLDLTTVLRRILKLTNKLFESEAGSVMLIQNNRHLAIEAARGLSRAVVSGAKIPVGEGIAGWVARTGKPLLLEGKVTDSRFRALVDRKDPIRSSLCVPLKARHRIIGVLALRRRKSARKFTPAQLHFLSVLADQAALAVENARLYREEKMRVKEMTRLNKTLSYEKLKMEGILSSMADGLVVTSADGKILLVNSTVEKIFGIDKSLMLGRSCHLPFSGFGLEKLYKNAREGRSCAAEIRLPKPANLCFKVMASPITDEAHKTAGIVFLWQDITELKRVAQVKSEIFSMVTHDLKTPLTSIQGFLDLVLSRNAPPEKTQKYLLIAREESDRLVRLINNLLDLSKLEAGALPVNRRPVDLARLIRATLSAVAVSPSQTIVFNPPAVLPRVFADEDLIIRVIHNLVSNAIKYSPGGGAIEIRVRRAGDFVEVDVEDHGIGIPEEKISDLFDPFYRVDSAAVRGIPGTGLGLANVKYIVEAHGGALRVKSRPGGGSVFTFNLPVVPEGEKK